MWNKDSEQPILEEQLTCDLTDRERIQTLISLAYIDRYNPENYSSLTDELAIMLHKKEEKYPQEYADYLHVCQLSLGNRGSYVKAIELCGRVLPHYKKLDDIQGESSVLLSLTNYHNALKNHNLARDYVERLRTLAEQKDVPYNIKASALYELANTYYGLDLPDLARKYGLMVLDYDAERRFGGLWVLSEIEIDKEDFAKALDYSQQALMEAETTDNTLWIMLITTKIGRCQRGLKQYDQALMTLHQGIENHQDFSDYHYANAALELGRVYRDAGRFEEAEEWMKKAFRTFEQEEKLPELSATMYALSNLYFAMEQYKDATIHLQSYDKLRSEVQEKNQKAEIASLATQYEFKLSQTELELSRFHNDVLMHQNKSLERANKEQQEILDIVAHDLKNPLATVKLTADILTRFMEKGRYDALPKRIGRIKQAVAYMSEVISQLTMMGRIDSDDITVDLQTIFVSLLLSEVIERNQTLISDKQIALELVDSHKSFVLADKGMLQRIFDNLLSNCIKYSPINSKIKISILGYGEWVEVAFIDQGVGMDPDEMSKLFTKFGRLSALPTGSESSIGLGLYIVKKFVEKMGGEILAESAGLGKGSMFIVRLRHSIEAKKLSTSIL